MEDVSTTEAERVPFLIATVRSSRVKCAGCIMNAGVNLAILVKLDKDTGRSQIVRRRPVRWSG